MHSTFCQSVDVRSLHEGMIHVTENVMAQIVNQYKDDVWSDHWIRPADGCRTSEQEQEEHNRSECFHCKMKPARLKVVRATAALMICSSSILTDTGQHQLFAKRLPSRLSQFLV